MTGTAHSADLIDLLAGIAPGDPLDAVREGRPQARHNAQRSFAALLEPDEPGTFGEAERYAVATYVAVLHGAPAGEAFYADLLADEDPRLSRRVRDAAAATATAGPYGAYRETGLAGESTAGLRVSGSDPAFDGIDARLAAGLAHAHLLVFRPRESSPGALRALEAAGWSADDIVTLSQLVSFLAFQLRQAAGLRALAGRARDASAPAVGSGAGSTVVTDGASVLDADRRPEAFTQEGLGWVPWLEPVAEDALTDAQRDALIDDFRIKSPYFRLLVRDPEALKARTLTDLDIFFNTDGGIGRAERELAATAASRANGCVFCASVHAARATSESGRGDDVQRLLDEGVGADLGDAVWNAVVEASVALTATPPRFGSGEVARLRAAGLGDAEIVDVIGGAAFFNWANRLMLSLGEPEVPARRRGGSK